MHLLIFIKKLASVLCLAFIMLLAAALVCYRKWDINHAKDSLSHSSSIL